MSELACSVSVVIPCYRSSFVLERAVDSVLIQTRKPIEIILVDDCSDDGLETQRVMHKIEQNCEYPEIKIRLIFLEKNLGPGAARNKGWDMAQGDFIAFLDSDDIWHPQKLERQYELMKKSPTIDISSHKSSVLGDLDTLKFIFEKKVASYSLSLRAMIFSNKVETRSVMLKRTISLRFPGERYSEDYSLWMRMLEAGYNFVLINENLAFSFSEPYSKNGLSGSICKMELGELKVLKNLMQSEKISTLLLILAIFWSLTKFVRRVLIVSLRGLVSNG